MPVDPNVRIPAGPLAVLIFFLGLLGAFFVAGVFGIAPPVFWAAVVIFFFISVFFLAHPKVYLLAMLIYFGFFTNAILLGRFFIPVPFSQVFDELILVVPLAILVMRGIQRTLPRHATWFPLFYTVLCVLSYKANQAPLMNALRVWLTFGKFYIFWYFARAAGPWSAVEKKRVVWMVVLFALVQLPFNVIWHRGLRVTIGDFGTGTIGDAHMVGYVSTYGLFLLLALFLAKKHPFRPRPMAGYGVIAALISYNLIFLTDSKHVLVLLPLVGLPVLLSVRRSLRLRLFLVGAALAIALPSYAYLSSIRREGKLTVRPSDYWYAMIHSGKGEVLRTILHELPDILPYPWLGAGPGNFCSAVATSSYRPLAVQYVLPYVIHALRSGGLSTESSVIGNPRTTLFILWGEMGVINALGYLGFWLYVLKGLWARSRRRDTPALDSECQIALFCNLVFLMILGLLIDTFSISILTLPLWALIGIFWDPSPATRTHAGAVRRIVP
jgi:hypothetical protein